MTIEERKEYIDRKLRSMGETVVTWSKKNHLDHRMVINLIEGNLLGTRGVPLKARKVMEEYFGKVFDQ